MIFDCFPFSTAWLNFSTILIVPIIYDLPCFCDSYSARKSRWERLRLDDHRMAFEIFQADLESFVETLSGTLKFKHVKRSV